MTIGIVEILIIGLILIAVFGAGRLGNVGGTIGKTISNFKSEVKSESNDQ